MTEEQKLMKETFDLLKDVMQEFVENKLPLLRRYIDLEGKVNKNLSDALVGKPSLFDKPAVQNLNPTQPISTQHIEPRSDSIFDPPVKKVTDPLSMKAGGEFDHMPPPPEPKKEPVIVKDKMKLPWEQDANEPESHPLGERIAGLAQGKDESPF
jgi:hypothetical protein